LQDKDLIQRLSSNKEVRPQTTPTTAGITSLRMKEAKDKEIHPCRKIQIELSSGKTAGQSHLSRMTAYIMYLGRKKD